MAQLMEGIWIWESDTGLQLHYDLLMLALVKEG